MNVIEACVSELLSRGAIDWVSSNDVAGVAWETGGAVTGAENRLLCLRLITEVVRCGLMEVGDLDPVTRGFRRWAVSPEEALARIERTWPAGLPDPRSSEICWLNNTPEGERREKRRLTPPQ
jgi:hypothetical protein